MKASETILSKSIVVSVVSATLACEREKESTVRDDGSKFFEAEGAYNSSGVSLRHATRRVQAGVSRLGRVFLLDFDCFRLAGSVSQSATITMALMYGKEKDADYEIGNILRLFISFHR